MNEKARESFVLVFQSADQVKFDLVKGFLRAQGIPFTTAGDASAAFGTAIQKNARDANWEARGCQLFVPPDYAKRAQTLLKRVEK